MVNQEPHPIIIEDQGSLDNKAVQEHKNGSTTIDVISNLLTSKNTSITTQRGKAMARALRQYQEAIQNGVFSTRTEIRNGLHRTKEGTEMIPETPEGIVKFLQESKSIRDFVPLADTVENVDPEIADSHNAALIEALGMLPHGQTIDTFMENLRKQPAVECTTEADFQKVLENADEKGVITKVIHKDSSGKYITPAPVVRGLRNNSFGGITLGFTMGQPGAVMHLPENLRVEAARASFNRSLPT